MTTLPFGFFIMQAFAALIAIFARLLSLLTGGDATGEAPAIDRHAADPLALEPRVWEKVALWLGWNPPRARRAPAYVRRLQPDRPQHPDRH